MALQLWMPLMGDLRNQGLSNFDITTLGTISWVNGKLGAKALQAGNANQTTNGVSINSNLTDLLSEEYSISVWVKPLGNHVHYNGTILSSGNWNYTCWAFGVSQDNTKVDILSNGYNVYVNCTIPVNEWTHLVCTCNSSNQICLYKNGEYITYITRNDKPQSDATYATIGRETYANGYFSFNGAIQDLRLYNHCLSEMEVKKLSQGLILHYPLNRQGFGQDNILLNTGFESQYTQSTGWDTTKNGTQLANFWGGYNSGVTNQATVYHAHLKEFNGEWVYEYIRTASEGWLGICQGDLQSKLTAGKTYTFSWEEYHVNGTNRAGTGLYYYKTGATSAGFHLGIQQAAEVTREIGKWQKYTYTFTVPNDVDWSKNMIWYVYGHYNGNGTFYVRHIKLEEGSIATPWCPNSSDALATTMGLNGTTEYDCSGYCNNSVYNSKPTVSSDTPKYNVSTYFGAYNTPKTDINDASLLYVLTNCSIAWWAKTDVAKTLFFTGQDGSHYVMASNNNNFYHQNVANPIIYRDGVAGTYKNEAGVWHHYVMTGVSLTSWTQFRINSYSGWPLNGLISDLRIYATALSADDVKSLYQNCATIDPDGTIHGQIR